MIISRTNTLTIAIIFGPAFAVASVYGLFFHRPLNCKIAAQQSIFVQAQVSTARIDWETEQNQLIELQSQLRRLSEQSVETKNHHSTLVAKRRSLSTRFLENTAPAGSIAQFLSIGQSAGLDCLSVQPKTEPTETIPEQWKALAVDSSPKNNQKYEHCEVLITLSGTYLQMQSALSSLGEQSLSAKILSLNMSPIEGQSEQRSWQWAVWLGSELR